MLTDASITQSKPNLTARPTPETDQSLKYALNRPGNPGD